MTKIVEERHEGEPEWLWKVGNLLTVDQDIVKSWGVAWVFKEDGKWAFKPRIVENRSLFYNAVFFIRFNWPLGVFWSIRWSSKTDQRAMFQTGIGIKLNGRFGLPLRFPSDASSAAGVTGPNLGQATGFNFGTH